MENFESEMFGQLAECLEDLEHFRMPFGRFGPENFPPGGKLIYELPLEYLTWFKEHGGGFPRGRLGELMGFVYEIKLNGAEEIFAPLRNATQRENGYW